MVVWNEQCLWNGFPIMLFTLLHWSSYFLSLFFLFFFQSLNSEGISEDIIESLRDDHRSGRSLDSLDKTLDDFSTESTFSVRKTAIPVYSTGQEPDWIAHIAWIFVQSNRMLKVIIQRNLTLAFAINISSFNGFHWEYEEKGSTGRGVNFVIVILLWLNVFLIEKYQRNYIVIYARDFQILAICYNCIFLSMLLGNSALVEFFLSSLWSKSVLIFPNS